MKKVYPYDEHVLDTLGATFPDRQEADWSTVSWAHRPYSQKVRTMKLLRLLAEEYEAETTEAGREAIAEARAVAIRDMEG